MVRIKFYQFYGFGQYPRAVVFDKVDIVGSTIHPFYRWATTEVSSSSLVFTNMSPENKNKTICAIILRYFRS